MVGLFATPLRRGLVLALALFLGACGMNPVESSNTSSPGKDDSIAALSAWNKLTLEENRLLADPLCLEVDKEYGPMIATILERHNKALAQISGFTSQNLLKAGYPDYQGGVSLRVCDDPNIYAYSYPKTVALHTGLLKTLKEAAGEEYLFASSAAFVIYHELGHIQMGHAGRSGVLGEASGAMLPFSEIEADMFAATVLQKAGYSMEGVDLVFSVLSQINPAGSAVHPPSWERLERVRRLTGIKEAS
ncbi:hypothetical protein MNBD_NITROSPINAE02-925 [hydrothermal vent metagenome]|uniref:Peptidase M48 domain-containing protein n=1 Tax=hydrothermal vent metagenome TaxID=652676 RepID=A0A3B1BNE6_9ZZZZ